MARFLGRVIPCSDPAQQRHNIIGNRTGFGRRREREWGHRRRRRRVDQEHPPCAFTLLGMTESRCAARRRRQSMTARLPLRRTRSCTLPGSISCGRQSRPCRTRSRNPTRPSKQDVVIAMLRQPEGATVDEVASVTGWQRHTVRGVFSGTLKKKLGLTLASAKEERGRVYRIAEPASL